MHTTFKKPDIVYTDIITVSINCLYRQGKSECSPNIPCYFSISTSNDKECKIKLVNNQHPLSFCRLLNKIIALAGAGPNYKITIVSHNLEDIYKCTSFHNVFMKKVLGTITELNRAFLTFLDLCNKYKIYYDVSQIKHYAVEWMFKKEQVIKDMLDKIKSKPINESKEDIKHLTSSLEIIIRYLILFRTKNNKLKYIAKAFKYMHSIYKLYMHKNMLERILPTLQDPYNKPIEEKLTIVKSKIRQTIKYMTRKHNIKSRGSKIYGSFQYRKVCFELVDLSLILSGHMLKIIADFDIAVPEEYAQHNCLIPYDHNYMLNTYIQICDFVSSQTLQVYRQFKESINTISNMLIVKLKNENKLTCKCEAIYIEESEQCCQKCIDLVLTKIHNKTFFTVCSISEYIVTKFSYIYKDPAIFPKYPEIQFNKPRLESWDKYFKCRYHFDITGPHNSQYVVGEYNEQNIVDLDLNSAYPSLMLNILNKVYDFSKVNIVRCHVKILDTIKILNKYDIPFLIKVKFEYEDNYYYTMIANENNLGTSLYCQKGTSKFITSYEYNRLLDSGVVSMRPKILKYFSCINNDTPFSYILETFISLRKNAKGCTNTVLKMLSNGIYGKLLQKPNKTKTHYSLNTGMAELGKPSKITNPYLGNLIIGGCKAAIGTIIHEAYKLNLNIVSSITDGCLILNEHQDSKVIDKLLDNLSVSDTLLNILPQLKSLPIEMRAKAAFSIKINHTDGSYLGIKKRMEAIYPNSYVMSAFKQSIGSFSHKDNVNLKGIYKAYISGQPIRIHKQEKASIKDLLEHGRLRYESNIMIPNLDPNTDKLPEITNSLNYRLKPHANLFQFIMSRRIYEYKYIYYRYRDKHKDQNSNINGFLYKPEAREAYYDAINLDHLRLGGFAETYCVFTKLAYLTYSQHAKSKAAEDKIDYKATYKIAKELNMLEYKGKIKKKLSDSIISEKIGYRFLNWINNQKDEGDLINKVTIMDSQFRYLEQELYRHNNNKIKDIETKLLTSMDTVKYLNEQYKLNKNNDVCNLLKKSKDELKELKAKYKAQKSAAIFIKKTLKLIREIGYVINLSFNYCTNLTSIFNKLKANNVMISNMVWRSTYNYLLYRPPIDNVKSDVVATAVA